MSVKNTEFFKLIEDFIDDYREANGATPTIREIEAGLGIPKSTVGRYLVYMRDQGITEWRWTPVGMRSFCVLRLNPCRARTLISV
ncbi:MAG: hypothetical protein LUG93_02895 [Lachnospiraceae bacterium]|nr:hypothetical protein [Lachnospiraceae bacterium]